MSKARTPQAEQARKPDSAVEDEDVEVAEDVAEDDDDLDEEDDEDEDDEDADES